MNIEKTIEQVRDIPYQIPLTLDDKAVDCAKKHEMLAELLREEGVEVRFRVCSFLWSEQEIPQRILDIQHVDSCEHLFLEVFSNDKWLTLDISWDIKLKNLFKIAEWDSEKGTEISVEPVKIYPVGNDGELRHNETEESFLKDIKDNGEFYQAINEWLESERI